MPGKIQIRSKKGLKKICGKLITHKWTAVDADSFMKWKSTRMGEIVFKESLEVYSDVKSAKRLESAEVKELRETRSIDKQRIKLLEDENASLKARIVVLESEVPDVPEEVEAPEEVVEVETTSDEGFTFDPEEHTIDHRGNGKYFVMDLNEEKVYGPLTDDERSTFNAMIEEA